MVANQKAVYLGISLWRYLEVSLNIHDEGYGLLQDIAVVNRDMDLTED